LKTNDQSQQINKIIEKTLNIMNNQNKANHRNQSSIVDKNLLLKYFDDPQNLNSYESFKKNDFKNFSGKNIIFQEKPSILSTDLTIRANNSFNNLTIISENINLNIGLNKEGNDNQKTNIPNTSKTTNKLSLNIENYEFSLETKKSTEMIKQDSKDTRILIEDNFSKFSENNEIIKNLNSFEGINKERETKKYNCQLQKKEINLISPKAAQAATITFLNNLKNEPQEVYLASGTSIENNTIENVKSHPLPESMNVQNIRHGGSKLKKEETNDDTIVIYENIEFNNSKNLVFIF